MAVRSRTAPPRVAVPGLVVDDEVADRHGRRHPPPPAQHGAHPRDQLGEQERLDDVVVGAAVEAVQAVGERVAGGEQDQPRVAALAHHAEQTEAVAAGQHDVEDDEVGPEPVEQLLEPLAVAAPERAEARVLERLDDRLADRRLVLDDEHARRRAPGATHTRILAPRC